MPTITLAMKRFFKEILRRVLYLSPKGRQVVLVNTLLPYIEAKGWLRSLDERASIDKEGNPIPWITYPSITFLEQHLKPTMRVFEYGSGNSTKWWSQQVKSVVACEHDKTWYDLLKADLPENTEYIFCELEYDGAYCRTAQTYPNQFDLLVIDGRDRVNCARNCLPALKPDGVILWDNSDRDYYQEGYDFLTRNGFKRIDFWGIGPINHFEWSTSVFYRQNNCFGL